MNDKLFDPKKLAKLNDPKRFKILPPKFLFKALNKKDVTSIVDIGAGTGFYSKMFVDYYKGATLYACDISTVMLDWMDEFIIPDYPQIQLYEMDPDSVSLEDGLADIVVMIYLHHELVDPVDLLKECKRILKPDGKILISDWRKVDTPMGPPLAIRLDTETVKEQLIEAGFSNVEIHDDLAMNFVIVAE